MKNHVGHLDRTVRRPAAWRFPAAVLLPQIVQEHDGHQRGTSRHDHRNDKMGPVHRAAAGNLRVDNQHVVRQERADGAAAEEAEGVL